MEIVPCRLCTWSMQIVGGLGNPLGDSEDGGHFSIFDSSVLTFGAQEPTNAHIEISRSSDLLTQMKPSDCLAT